MWVREFQSDTFLEEMEATWQGLKPLYEQVLNTNKKVSKQIHIFFWHPVQYLNISTQTAACLCPPQAASRLWWRSDEAHWTHASTPPGQYVRIIMGQHYRPHQAIPRQTKHRCHRCHGRKGLDAQNNVWESKWLLQVFGSDFCAP